MTFTFGRASSGSFRNRHLSSGVGLAVAAILALLVSGPLCVDKLAAQDFERFRPQVPKNEKKGQIREDSNEEPSSDADAEAAAVELLPALKGLVFVPLVSDVQLEGRPGVTGVLVEDVALMDQADWQKRLEERFGAPFSMADLNAVMREIILYYRGEGRPVVDVVVVEQDITSGVVQLAVIEAALGEVRAEGAKWFKAERIAGQIRLKPGEPIYSTILLADLAWLNKNPFRSVDLVYTPGEEDGETDVVLKIDDRFPMRVYSGYEDSGNALTGNNRWVAGVNYGNLWGLDHLLNYQWTFNNQTDQLSAHSFSYVAPLPWRHTFSVYGAYVESAATIPPLFNLGGETAQLSGRYTIPLPDKSGIGHGKFDHELEFGYDFKYSTSNLEFGIAQVQASATDVHQFSATYRASLRDSLGATSLGLTGYVSPGDFAGYNNDTAFQGSRAGSSASYSYGQINLERTTALPAGYTSVIRATGQFADTNLLPSEQLGYGGYSSVRGYEEREANVDQGVLLTAEVRAPAISLLHLLKIQGAQDQLQMLAFWDYANGSNVNRLVGEADRIILSSMGPGFRWSIADHFSMRFDYGFQLRDSEQGLGLGNSRMHIGGTVSY